MFELRTINHNRNHHDNYDPFRAMEAFENHFFRDPFGPAGHDFFSMQDFGEISTDIKDEGDQYLLEADLPGFDKKDIHLDLNGDTLTIQAERHSEHEDKDKEGKYLRCERSYGSYSRSFNMEGIDTNGIRAKYDNGVLKLTLPKLQETLPTSRCLEIE